MDKPSQSRGFLLNFGKKNSKKRTRRGDLKEQKILIPSL
jgi:hypothetical protein